MPGRINSFDFLSSNTSISTEIKSEAVSFSMNDLLSLSDEPSILISHDVSEELPESQQDQQPELSGADFLQYLGLAQMPVVPFLQEDVVTHTDSSPALINDSITMSSQVDFNVELNNADSIFLRSAMSLQDADVFSEAGEDVVTHTDSSPGLVNDSITVSSQVDFNVELNNTDPIFLRSAMSLQDADVFSEAEGDVVTHTDLSPALINDSITVSSQVDFNVELNNTDSISLRSAMSLQDADVFSEAEMVSLDESSSSNSAASVNLLELARSFSAANQVRAVDAGKFIANKELQQHTDTVVKTEIHLPADRDETQAQFNSLLRAIAPTLSASDDLIASSADVISSVINDSEISVERRLTERSVSLEKALLDESVVTRSQDGLLFFNEAQTDRPVTIEKTIVDKSAVTRSQDELLSFNEVPIEQPVSTHKTILEAAMMASSLTMTTTTLDKTMRSSVQTDNDLLTNQNIIHSTPQHIPIGNQLLMSNDNTMQQLATHLNYYFAQHVTADTMNELVQPATDLQAQIKMELTSLKAEVLSDPVNYKLENYTAQIKVHPQELGEITAKIEVNDGNASIVFMTENAHVKQLMENSLHNLHHAFQDAAVNLNSVNVEHGGTQEKNHQSHYSKAQGWDTLMKKDHEASHHETATTQQKNSIIDIYA